MIRRAALGLRVARRARVQTRGYASSSVSDKISVVPFQASIHDAQKRMYMAALVAAPSMTHFAFAALLKLFGPAFEPIGLELGLGDWLKLKSIVPAYYPVWRVDAIAEGPVSPMRGGKETSARLSVREAYVPGNPYAPLSYLSFAVPPLPDDLRPYDPSRDLKQIDGHEIAEVPFTVNPLALVDTIRRRVGRRCEIPGGFKIDESKWQEKLVAAYPIMFPIYIAEYEYHAADDDIRRFPVILDAHEKDVGNCRPSFPLTTEVREHVKRAPKNFFATPSEFAPELSFSHPAEVMQPMSEFEAEHEAEDAYTSWMSPAPRGNSIDPSPTLRISQNSKIDWEDARIQSWSSEERMQNGIYLEKGDEVHKTISAYQRMSDAFDGKGITLHIEGEDGKSSQDTLTAGLEDTIQKLQQELKDLKPQWLIEYEDRARKEAASEKNDEA